MRGHGQQRNHDADVSSGTATVTMFALAKDPFGHRWQFESLISLYFLT